MERKSELEEARGRREASVCRDSRMPLAVGSSETRRKRERGTGKEYRFATLLRTRQGKLVGGVVEDDRPGGPVDGRERVECE